MGKVILAAVVAAVVSALVTAAVLSTLGRGDRSHLEERVAAAEKRVADQQSSVDTALRSVDRIQAQVRAAAQTATARAERADASEGASAAPPPHAPDGTPWVSRAELDKALREHRPAAPAHVEAVSPPEKKSIEEIARDMGLSATEEANVRQIVRESEEEAVKCLFGDRPIADVAADFKAAEEDPDRMEELVQRTITQAFSNLGKLATLESRTKKRVEEQLGKDRAKDFLGRPRKPVLEVDLEELLGEGFGD